MQRHYWNRWDSQSSYMFPHSWIAAGVPRFRIASAPQLPIPAAGSIDVALDSTGAAEQALPVAMAFARRRSAPLRLLHVRNPAEEAQGLDLCLVDNSKSLAVESRSGAYLKSLAESLRSEGVAVQAVAIPGTSVEGTLRSHCDAAGMLVLARPKRSTLSRLWWGSVTDSLVGSLAVPLVIVPTAASSGADPTVQRPVDVRRVLIHLDSSAAAQRVIDVAASVVSERAVCKLLRLLPLSSLYSPGRSGAAQAFELRRQAWQDLFHARDQLEQHGLTCQPQLILDGRTVGASLIEQARAMRAQLIVVEARQHRLPWWLRNGVAEYVVRHATVPVLIVPADQKDVSQKEVHHVDIHSN